MLVYCEKNSFFESQRLLAKVLDQAHDVFAEAFSPQIWMDNHGFEANHLRTAWNSTKLGASQNMRSKSRKISVGFLNLENYFLTL